MKICIIGNSHVGALKNGYELIKENRQVAIDFYSIPGGGGPNLMFSDDRVVNTISSIRTTVELGGEGLALNDYNIILLSGVGIHAIRNSNKHILQSNLLSEFIINEQDKGFSKSLLKEMLKEFFFMMPSVINIEKISSVFNGKLYIQMFPIPTSVLFEQSDFNLPYDKKSIMNFISWYYTIQEEFLYEVTKQRVNIEFIPYPKDWIASGRTPSDYATNDAWHMNKEFGRFYIEKLISLEQCHIEAVTDTV
jgi:hypothetical protein